MLQLQLLEGAAGLPEALASQCSPQAQAQELPRSTSCNRTFSSSSSSYKAIKACSNWSSSYNSRSSNCSNHSNSSSSSREDSRPKVVASSHRHPGSLSRLPPTPLDSLTSLARTMSSSSARPVRACTKTPVIGMTLSQTRTRTFYLESTTRVSTITYPF